MDASKRDLEKSVRPERENSLTISNGHVAAVSNDLEATHPIDTVEDTYEGYSPALDAAEPRNRDRAWMVSTIVSRAATYHIRKVRERSTTRPTTDHLRHIHIRLLDY